MDPGFGSKFRVGRKIGSGSFGDIFEGISIKTGDKVAMKFEPTKSANPVLLYEAKLYKLLEGSTGIPRIHWYGVTGDYTVMVMDLLGPSLEDQFCRCRNKFSLKTVLMLAEQMLNRVERLHSKSIVHRDIKPENFLVGQGDKSTQVFMIDLGCAKRYRDPVSLEHIPYRLKTALTGTVRYLSVNGHRHYELSRRDDLESLGYVFMYFLRGKLPWQGLRTRSTEERYRMIADVKSTTPVEELCAHFPPEFVTYFNYCRRLRFEEKPDYSHLRSLFRQVFVREAYKEDLCFDWHLGSRPPASGSRSQVEDGEVVVAC